MTRTRIRQRCAACDRPLKAGRGKPCVRGCGAKLCRAPHIPYCTDLHGGQCSNLQLPDEENPVTEPPTDRDVLVVAALVDNLASAAAIEDAFRTEPLTRQEQVNEAAVRIIHETGTPEEIAAADVLMDLYKVGAFRGDV